MQKGFIPIIILVGILVIIVVVGGAYFFGKSQTINPQPLAPQACTDEAMVCPDGSAVGRTGPNCEFSLCPSVASTTSEGSLSVAAELAKKDLAKSLGINESQIVLQKTEKAEWRNSSLGCPRTGQMYLQVITQGYKVIFSYDQKEYEYHTDNGSQFVKCDGKV